jgi:dihydrofolate reductase
MGNVLTSITMSLDGFVAGPNDDITHLFKWYFSGPVEIPVQEGRMSLNVSEESANLLKQAIQTTGAMVTGRRNFDGAGAWQGHPPFAPCFVVTHRPAQEWEREGSPFVFVSDGVESAIAQAKAAAGDKNVAIATPGITQQCLQAGLLDEIHVDLAPVLLGDGLRLFDHLTALAAAPVALEPIRVLAAPGVIHLGFRVLKNRGN